MILPFFIASLSLCDFATNAAAGRIESADPSRALSRFVNYEANARNDEFVPNTNFWLRGVDLSCVSPWNSRGGRCRAGTAISRRHVVFAAHLPLTAGDRLVFVDDAGGVCPCRIEKTKRIGTTDIMIGSLDYELTPNIKPAKILPENYEQFIGNGEGLPVVQFSQFEQAYLMGLSALQTNALPWNVCCHPVKSPKAMLCRKPIIGGDSGNPVFLLIGDEPILLFCLHRGGCGSGPPLHRYRREIQAAMDELYPGYKLEVFDFGKIVRK